MSGTDTTDSRLDRETVRLRGTGYAENKIKFGTEAEAQ